MQGTNSGQWSDAGVLQAVTYSLVTRHRPLAAAHWPLVTDHRPPPLKRFPRNPHISLESGILLLTPRLPVDLQR
jgi:hypothetical protein